MTAPDVLLLGETMLALRSSSTLTVGGTLATSIAGAESNVAIALARLGHRAAWVGRVGVDAPGDLVLRTLRAEGVDVDGVRRDTASTGVIFFEARLPRLHRVTYVRSGSAGSRLSAEDVEVSAGTRVLHVTGVTAALGDQPRAAIRAAVGQARDLGITISLDLNYRGRLWTREEARPVLADLAAQVDVVFASPEELALLATDGETPTTADLARRLVEAGVREVVVKNGGQAAYVFGSAGMVTEPALRITVQDPVGAGDAFVGGYLSGMLDELPVRARLRRAHTLGAFAASTDGDWEGLPARAELDLFDTKDGAVLR